VKKTKKYFKRAEAYVKEFRMKERDEIRLARNAKKAGDFYIPPEPKLAFIMRIRGYVCIFNLLDLITFLIQFL